MKCIDVSSHQGKIDWNKVKSQVDAVIIRCGYGDNINKQDDTEFFRNVNNCIEKNIPFGIYLYSYAKNLNGNESISSEIDHCIRLLNKINSKPFCVYLDMEDNSTIYLGKKTLSNFALEFCYKISQAGYKSGIYANEYWFRNYLDVKEIKKQGYSIWCAKYSSNKPNIGEDYDIWQYSSTGQIQGINGSVDMNIIIKDIINLNNNIVNVYYRVKTKDYGWLPEVLNLEDYAGWKTSPIIGIAIKVDKGKIKYRVHLKNKGWLSYVSGYNIYDIKNGYAGNGKNIVDAIEVYYYTPDNIRPYKKAKYRINNYDWQYDNEKDNHQDGYAGKFGTNATKFQITIE